MFKRDKKNNKGFTLVELVIVIAILAILVGLLAPQYTKYVEKSRKAADANNMDEMVKVVKVYAADPANELPAGVYTITISDKDSTEANNVSVIAAKLPDGTVAPSTEDVNKLKAALSDSIPKYEATRTKSKKWNDGDSASIQAAVTVNEDGGTSVKYSVVGFSTEGGKKDPFENYMTTGTDGIK